VLSFRYARHRLLHWGGYPLGAVPCRATRILVSKNVITTDRPAGSPEQSAPTQVQRRVEQASCLWLYSRTSWPSKVLNLESPKPRILCRPCRDSLLLFRLTQGSAALHPGLLSFAPPGLFLALKARREIARGLDPGLRSLNQKTSPESGVGRQPLRHSKGCRM
jgi:hypothetical protein